ncbi:FG-GAP-like repeat-containing protein [Streptomyces sp. NBC_00280]|uniref:FG-GAP-like repeat-containing protein n=1 Tax=Streptomyces sp. NBC_00280 TaxID=2975699 RepID=UPI00325402D9
MGRHALIRGGIAVATSLTLTMGLGPLAFDAHAAAAAEVIIPAETSLQPWTAVLSAGPSGFLRYESGRGHLWTTYTGEDTVVDSSATETWGMPEFGAGSDVVARYDSDTRTVSLRDMAAGGTTVTIPLPEGHTYQGTLGRTVVTATSSGSRTWHLLDAEDDGTVRDRPVAGVPDGITEVDTTDAPLGDADGMLVRYRVGGVLRSGWLDADEARLVELAHDLGHVTTSRTVLTATHLLAWDGFDTVSVYSRDDLTAPAVRTVPLENDARTALLGMVGDTLLVSRYDSSLGALDGNLPVWRVDSVAADGSTTGTVLARSRTFSVAVPTPDGGLLVPGSGRDTAEWGVNLIRAGSDGTPVVQRVADAELQSVTDPVQRLTLANGRLTVLERDKGQDRAFMYSRPVDMAGDTLTVGARTNHGTGGEPEIVATGDGRTVVWNLWSSGADPVPRVVQPTGSLPGTAIDPSHNYVRVMATAGRHVAMATQSTDEVSSVTRVIDLDTSRTVLVPPQHGMAMWGTTLWIRDGNGSAVPIDVRTGKQGESVYFGRGCLLENLQAVGRWLLWSCVGSREAQGVYDTVRKTSLTLTEGAWETAKLGDGFVVTAANGALKVTDVRTGAAVSHTVEASRSWEPWDVDPYTGLIAYVDARNNTHLLSSGIPVSPLTQLDSSVAAAVDVKGGATSWSPKWWLSKPAASWKLVIRNKATGATLRTLSGGTARGVIPASWNGKDTAGRLVPNGTYTWTLTATPADGQGATLTKTGTVKVTGAAPVRRDFFGSDGFGELLTLNASGGLSYHYGTGTGTLTGKRTGSGWPATVRAVPFGDLSGDRCNDVLVRFADGTLRAYRPACGAAVTASTAYTSLGSGWNQYDVLTSPGDVTGDGRADLIARQASTGDIYLYRATTTGKLSARLKIHSGFKAYKKILGAGDLNGDGHGDLLAQDSSNELWRYDGTATGKFKGRVKVFNDWGASYNVIVGVGDITGDGRADLVSRDTAGTLWRNNGNGKGSFGGRTKIATGWQGYKGLF